MSIRPEVRVFIQALRAGKSGVDALEEYCWAKSVLPVREEDYRRNRSSVTSLRMLMCEAMASDAFDEGKTDDEVAEEFNKGLAYDRDRGVLWRAMEKHERPSAGDLVRAMSSDERNKSGDLLGYGNVARMLTSK
jgi:hypothetical protein